MSDAVQNLLGPDGRFDEIADSGSSKHFLLCTAQLVGHIAPLVAIGKALIAKGHKVYLITAKVSEKMPGRLLAGSGITFLPAGVAPENERLIAKYLSEKLGPKVNTFVKIVRGRTHLMTLDARILKHLLDSGMLNDEGITYNDEVTGRQITFRPDLVIGDHYSSMFTGENIADRFGIPLIYNSPTVLWDQPSFPFPYPLHTFPRGMKDMTLFDRVLSEVFRRVDGYGWIKYMAARYARQAIRDSRYTNLLKIRPDPGVLRFRLANTAVPFDYPVSVPPLIVYTGALIQSASKDDLDGTKALVSYPGLKDWLDKQASASVVVISMGSAARLSMWQGTAFLEGLQALGSPVLWALREDNREFLPDGSGSFDGQGIYVSADQLIRLETWIPQQAVLAHAAVGAFVGHCGMGGTHEALYNGVPMLGLPVFIDQPEVAARLRDVGAGLSLDPAKITPEAVTENLSKLLGKVPASSSNVGDQVDDASTKGLSSYAIQARKVSKSLQHHGGVKKAVEVCELALDVGTDLYILPTHTLPYWKRNKLDVYGVLLASTVITVGAASYLGARLYRSLNK